MAKTRIRFFNGARGLSNPGNSRPDDYTVFQDVEVDGGDFKSRKGMVRLARIANTESTMDFDATNNLVTLGTIASSLGTVFTVEVLFLSDTISADRYIIGRAAAANCGITIRQTTTSTVVAVVRDTAGNTVTLTWTGIAAGTTCGLQITRNGAAVSGWLNGTTQTGTLASATTSLATGLQVLGADNSAGYHDGCIDYYRIWDIARTSKRDLFFRLLNPRNPHVVANWVLTQGENSYIFDYGKANSHTSTTGSPNFDRTPLSLSNPIQALAYSVRRNGTREILAVNSGRTYAATVT